jgi:hypothetical protein
LSIGTKAGLQANGTKSEADRIQVLAEQALQAAWEYERDGRPETFFQWARFQQALRAVEQFNNAVPGGAPDAQAVWAGTVALMKDLLAAQARYQETPTDLNRSELLRSRLAYQTLANRLPSSQSTLAPKALQSLASEPRSVQRMRSPRAGCQSFPIVSLA